MDKVIFRTNVIFICMFFFSFWIKKKQTNYPDEFCYWLHHIKIIFSSVSFSILSEGNLELYFMFTP